MRKRMKFGRKKSRRDFRNKAQNVHPKNGLGGGMAMRGGIRL